MSSLGHRLAFGWGFFFGVACALIGLKANGVSIKGEAIIFVLVVDLVLMVFAWFQCAKENSLLKIK